MANFLLAFLLLLLLRLEHCYGEPMASYEQSSMLISAGGQHKRHRRLGLLFPEWVAAADWKLLADSDLNPDLVVAQDGSGDYRSIVEAVAAVPKERGGSTTRFVIYVKAGVYKEYVEIPSSMENLMMTGDGIDATVVTGNRSVKDGYRTFQTPTFGYELVELIAKLNRNCDVHSQTQFYRNCDVYGTIDFIFGNAAVVFQNCNLCVRRPMSGQKNTVTAQGRNSSDQTTGISIHNSVVAAASDLAPVQGLFKTYLGRPWGNYSRTVVMKTELGDLIDPAGWLEWDDRPPPDTLYYGEFMNTGAGADTSRRVTWPGYHVINNSSEAEKFTVGSFLSGDSWIPATNIPFTSGL
ncbi:pectinesterase-like [Zingiber officinale]|uniref:pectinesterase-like n=1 Tax=Zingiber officinale TaxID=94328 RepID=UPI001C4D8249|nr:pectinesterase-like [Zingiber officinale]